MRNLKLSTKRILAMAMATLLFVNSGYGWGIQAKAEAPSEQEEFVSSKASVSGGDIQNPEIELYMGDTKAESMYVGKEYTVKISGNEQIQVDWSVDNPELCEEETKEGELHLSPVKSGTVKVTAIYSESGEEKNISATYAIHELYISNDKRSIIDQYKQVDKDTELTFYLFDENDAKVSKGVTWSIDGNAVQNGNKVLFNHLGCVTVKATYDQVEFSILCVVGSFVIKEKNGGDNSALSMLSSDVLKGDEKELVLVTNDDSSEIYENAVLKINGIESSDNKVSFDCECGTQVEIQAYLPAGTVELEDAAQKGDLLLVAESTVNVHDIQLVDTYDSEKTLAPNVMNGSYFAYKVALDKVEKSEFEVAGRIEKKSTEIVLETRSNEDKEFTVSVELDNNVTLTKTFFYNVRYASLKEKWEETGVENSSALKTSALKDHTINLYVDPENRTENVKIHMYANGETKELAAPYKVTYDENGTYVFTVETTYTRDSEGHKGEKVDLVGRYLVEVNDFELVNLDATQEEKTIPEQVYAGSRYNVEVKDLTGNSMEIVESESGNCSYENGYLTFYETSESGVAFLNVKVKDANGKIYKKAFDFKVIGITHAFDSEGNGIKNDGLPKKIAAQSTFSCLLIQENESKPMKIEKVEVPNQDEVLVVLKDNEYTITYQAFSKSWKDEKSKTVSFELYVKDKNDNRVSILCEREVYNVLLMSNDPKREDEPWYNMPQIVCNGNTYYFALLKNEDEVEDTDMLDNFDYKVISGAEHKDKADYPLITFADETGVNSAEILAWGEYNNQRICGRYKFEIVQLALFDCDTGLQMRMDVNYHSYYNIEVKKKAEAAVKDLEESEEEPGKEAWIELDEKYTIEKVDSKSDNITVEEIEEGKKYQINFLKPGKNLRVDICLQHEDKGEIKKTVFFDVSDYCVVNQDWRWSWYQYVEDYTVLDGEIVKESEFRNIGILHNNNNFINTVDFSRLGEEGAVVSYVTKKTDALIINKENNNYKCKMNKEGPVIVEIKYGESQVIRWCCNIVEPYALRDEETKESLQEVDNLVFAGETKNYRLVKHDGDNEIILPSDNLVITEVKWDEEKHAFVSIENPELGISINESNGISIHFPLDKKKEYTIKIENKDKNANEKINLFYSFKLTNVKIKYQTAESDDEIPDYGTKIQIWTEDAKQNIVASSFELIEGKAIIENDPECPGKATITFNDNSELDEDKGASITVKAKIGEDKVGDKKINYEYMKVDDEYVKDYIERKLSSPEEKKLFVNIQYKSPKPKKIAYLFGVDNKYGSTFAEQLTLEVEPKEQLDFYYQDRVSKGISKRYNIKDIQDDSNYYDVTINYNDKPSNTSTSENVWFYNKLSTTITFEAVLNRENKSETKKKNGWFRYSLVYPNKTVKTGLLDAGKGQNGKYTYELPIDVEDEYTEIDVYVSFWNEDCQWSQYNDDLKLVFDTQAPELMMKFNESTAYRPEKNPAFGKWIRHGNFQNTILYYNIAGENKQSINGYFAISDPQFNPANVSVIVKDKNGKKLSNSEYEVKPLTEKGNLHAYEVIFTNAKEYVVYVTYRDNAENLVTFDIKDRVEDKFLMPRFVLDNDKPKIGKITLSDSVHSITVSENGTTRKEHYYRTEATINVEYEDEFSPIVTRKAFWVDAETGKTTTLEVSKVDDYHGKIHLSGERKGYICYQATDIVGNESKELQAQKDVIIIDKTAPLLSFQYSCANNGDKDEILYYPKAENAQVTIQIQEKNFDKTKPNIWIKDLKTDKKTKLNSGKLTWDKSSNEDIYTTKIGFSNYESGKYAVLVQYTDRSNNEMEKKESITYESSTIVIDEETPTVKVSELTSPVIQESGVPYYRDGMHVQVEVTDNYIAAPSTSCKISVTRKSLTGTLEEETIQVEKWAREVENIHYLDIPFTKDGIYELHYEITDLAGHTTALKEAFSFVIDRIPPKDLKVSYSTPILEQVVEAISFGYYRAPVVATLTVEDDISSIDSIVYTYSKEASASGINAESYEVTIEKSNIAYSEKKNIATVSFEIPAAAVGSSRQIDGMMKYVAKDKVGNFVELSDQKRLIVDSIGPNAQIQFNDPVQSTNEMDYYDGDIQATLTINEANFFAEDVKVMVSKNGGEATNVNVSWSNESADRHIGRFSFQEEGIYRVMVEYADKSGNEMETYQSKQMTVDNQAPVIKIEGIENYSANKGEKIGFVISVEDNNLDQTAFKPEVILEKRNDDGTFESVDLTTVGKTETIQAGHSYKFTIDNLLNDGIYSVHASATDRAGNTTEEMLMNGTENATQSMIFSVNRYGSTYGLGEETRKLVGNFTKQPIDIVVYEVNPDKLKDIELTVFKDNQTITLQEGSDCDISYQGGNGSWYFYTYTMYAKNFETDGVYQVSTYSEDAAGNVARNTLDVKGVDISFIVDQTAPVLTVTNLDSNKTYPVDSLTVNMQVLDNMQLNTLNVVLDGKEVASWEKEQLNDSTTALTFTVPGDVLTAHTVAITLTDTAGNETVKNITKFYVTTNLWLRLLHNKALLFGILAASIVAVAGAGLFIVLLARRRRNG